MNRALLVALTLVATGCGAHHAPSRRATRVPRLTPLLAASGTIARPTEIDRFRFEASAGTRVAFIARPVAGRCGRERSFRWTVRDAAGTTVFDRPLYISGFCFSPGPLLLPRGGMYTIVVRTLHGATGRYAFAVWRSPVQRFALRLGGFVAPGHPARGAGRIEVPGGLDVYVFRARADTRVIVDSRAVGGMCGRGDTLRWSLSSLGLGRMLAQDELLHGNLTCHDADPVTLPVTGRYALSVYGTWPTWQTGTYSLLLVPIRR